MPSKCEGYNLRQVLQLCVTNLVPSSAVIVTNTLGRMHGLPDPEELELGNRESILRYQGGQAEE